MAMNSRMPGAMPEGTKYKVTIEKEGRKDYMMVYAPSKEQAIESVEESWRDTGWTVTGAEEAK